MVYNERNQIPMVDLKEELALIKSPILAALAEVLDSGDFILGEKGAQLEKLIAEYAQASYGLGVANGTDALQLSLQALNIGPGDEVITTPFTFFATAEVIAQVGAKPVFVDIEEETYNIDPSKIEDALTKNTKAIIVVHLYGQTANMEAIMKLAKTHNLYVIEDACQAIGTEYDGRRVGAIGDIGCFSFFPSKNLGAFGDAGLVVTNQSNLYEKVRELRNHGSEKKYQHTSIGMNSRLDEFQAATLLVKLDHLDIFLHKRKEVARRYTEGLNDLLKTPPIVEDRSHTFHQYCIELDNRDELALALKNNGIASAIYYPIPLHLQPAFDYLHYKQGDFPVAEKTADRILALPISPMLSFHKQDDIISTVQNFLENNG
ncbi:dTDP-4-amino-4,6-dideoxygalactose transaminase [Virgibacillus halotolerans]|uniref:DegT/DnrJ/EryC1/StrS family aminotransferase n=1 Tax=Virgibacillus halotolerans TaxID=1071053 RepID=UPI0019621999|nr:DegT/DnrJ/EryC1/StrS family aminotransferase [Virgibacillus halotolerans]MBM7599717.1 dTDP-4-amino-4,6-dideoxygalactose transaminase [Virgibacillus halotolerans]